MVESVLARGAMYKAVVQLVQLYGSKSWVVTGEMLKFLTAFHHRATQQITEMMTKRGAGGEWEYPAVEEAMDAAGVHPIGVYIKSHHITIADRVAFHSIYALCM